MDKNNFNKLLTSVRQMGDYLKGKKVRGVRVSFRTKPIKPTKRPKRKALR